MKIARTLFFFVMLILSTFFLGIISILGTFISRRWSYFMAMIWGRLNLWTAGVKVEIRGAENLDPKGAYILASNHQGWFDIFAMLGYFPIDFSWLAKEELFRIPVLGYAMHRTGYIPIDRANHRKALASMEACAEKIRQGASVFIFPEGTRSADGVIRDFKKGGFVLAAKSGRPIVPISISGSYLIKPKNCSTVQPGRITATIAKPVYAAGSDAKSRDRLIKLVRDTVRSNLTPYEAGEDCGETYQEPEQVLAANGGGLGRNA